MGQRLAFVFVFLCQNENKKLKQKKPKRENVLSLSAPVQEYLQHLQWVEACYALPCIKQPKGKSRTARAAHIFVDGVDLVRPGVASRLEVGDRGGLPKVLATLSRQRCAGLRAGAGQRCACQSACCVCHPHHLHDAVQAAQQAFGRALDAKCNGDDGKVAGQAKAAVRMTPTIKQLLMDHLKETLPPWVQLHHDPNKQARAFRVLVCGHGARCPVPIVDVCVCVCGECVHVCVHVSGGRNFCGLGTCIGASAPCHLVFSGHGCRMFRGRPCAGNHLGTCNVGWAGARCWCHTMPP